VAVKIKEVNQKEQTTNPMLCLVGNIRITEVEVGISLFQFFYR